MSRSVAAREGSNPVVLHRDGDVAWITLSRPEQANTIGHRTARAFRDIAETLAAAPVRVVVIGAEGKVFCGGGDVFEMSAADDLTSYLTQAAEDLHAGLLALTSFEPIIIAAINGAAAGAGFGIALTADVVIATDRARFLTAYEQVGLTPDGGVSYWLPRALGARRATAMSVRSLMLDSESAYSCGIVSQIVPVGELHNTVTMLAERLARTGVDALTTTRRLYGAFDHDEYAKHLALEARTLAANATRPETLALIKAFVDRER